ncbi:hypothetical protein PENTCL1PPCAC_15012, partial [Pristionchus entomophagus]
IVPRISICSIFLIYSFGLVTIFITRKRLFATMDKLKYAERTNHQLFYRSLTVQMLLPLAYIFGSSLWFLDVVGVVHSRTLQRSVLTVRNLFALVAPLINMYYIPPYKKFATSYRQKYGS